MSLACAHAILIGDYYPDTQVVSLVTKNIRDFGVRLAAVHPALGTNARAAPGAPGGRRPGADRHRAALRL